MKHIILGAASLALIFSLSGTAKAEEVTNTADVNCSDFSSLLAMANETSETGSLLESVVLLTSNCPSFGDQIVETAISLAPAEQHQVIMQSVADTGSMQPIDVLLAAIAGGGDPAILSEPTAGGNLAIVPPSAATAPPIIGGRNGGSPEGSTSGPNGGTTPTASGN
jgi:hypothetical protein